jgi:3-oxoisoapionate kinase
MLRLAFYGDDFTGSTDAMESLALAGLKTRLFTQPPTRDTLAKYPDLSAFGVAGMTRSMPPPVMTNILTPALVQLRDGGAPIVHYKVCSTFDSSPPVGSIGRVLEIGMEVFESDFVPIVVGAPALGRHCVFGNLFARLGAEGALYRLDRHPSMSRHPTTPMDEADLRVHLSKQTDTPVGLLDVLALENDDPDRILAQILSSGTRAVLIDLLHERQLATVGRLIEERADGEKPLLAIGSSGLGAALAAHWTETGVTSPTTFEPPGDAGPIVAVCGSMSPVTAAQVQWALANGFVEASDAISAWEALFEKKSVVIHSGGMTPQSGIGPALGQLLRKVIERRSVKRVIVAGGDTSGAVARELGIESMEMIAELTRGSPLCRVNAPGSPADGIEMTFKGGQIGRVEFFGQVRKGVSDSAHLSS